MKEVSVEKIGEILSNVRKFKYKEIAPVYIAAAFMVEAEASPQEVLSYLEEKFAISEVSV